MRKFYFDEWEFVFRTEEVDSLSSKWPKGIIKMYKYFIINASEIFKFLVESYQLANHKTC